MNAPTAISTPFASWNIGSGRKLIIAGPCSAESEEQVLQIARELSRCKIDVLRAGIWKPRTMPGMFEGVGEVGLAWLNRAKEATALPVTVEVATPRHVEACLNHKIDILWIGARTTVNPFSMQELAQPLSDAGQQLSPAQLDRLLKKIKFKSAHSDDTDFTSSLEHLRDKIDKADDVVIKALARRMQIVDEIGRYKKRNNVSILQPERWNEIIARRVAAGVRRNLSEHFMLSLYRYIHAESIEHQEEQFKNEVSDDRQRLRRSKHQGAGGCLVIRR